MMRRPGTMRSPWLVAAAACALAACAVGPDYHRPDVAQPAALTRDPLPPTTSGDDAAGVPTQRFVPVRAAPDDAAPVAWWHTFGSAELDTLVDRALARSPQIAQAEAALRQAQELTAAQRGAFWPSVQASYSPTRGRVAADVASPLSSNAQLYTLHTAQLSVGYVVDVFGGTRRAVEAQAALEASQAWQREAARTTLAANVVVAALQEASLREQLAATTQLVAIAQRQFDLLQVQRKLGAAPGAAVVSQEALLRQIEASAAGLRKQLAQQRHLLAVLVGTTPDDAPMPTFALSSLRLPDLPVAVPATIVERRPDVRAAEAQVRAANAQVGVAIANLLPQITLSANDGSSAAVFSELFKASSVAWSVGASVAQPLFEGGALIHRKRAAQAALDQAVAQYRATVLVAFQNVADALEAARNDADQHVATVRQEAAAQRALQIAQRQRELGDISGLTLLAAQSAYWQAAVARVQAAASRWADVAAAYQAFGGSVDVADPAAASAASR